MQTDTKATTVSPGTGLSCIASSANSSASSSSSSSSTSTSTKSVVGDGRLLHVKHYTHEERMANPNLDLMSKPSAWYYAGVNIYTLEGPNKETGKAARAKSDILVVVRPPSGARKEEHVNVIVKGANNRVLEVTLAHMLIIQSAYRGKPLGYLAGLNQRHVNSAYDQPGVDKVDITKYLIPLSTSAYDPARSVDGLDVDAVDCLRWILRLGDHLLLHLFRDMRKQSQLVQKVVAAKQLDTKLEEALTKSDEELLAFLRAEDVLRMGVKANDGGLSLWINSWVFTKTDMRASVFSDNPAIALMQSRGYIHNDFPIVDGRGNLISREKQAPLFEKAGMTCVVNLKLSLSGIKYEENHKHIVCVWDVKRMQVLKSVPLNDPEKYTRDVPVLAGAEDLGLSELPDDPFWGPGDQPTPMALTLAREIQIHGFPEIDKRKAIKDAKRGITQPALTYQQQAALMPPTHQQQPSRGIPRLPAPPTLATANMRVYDDGHMGPYQPATVGQSFGHTRPPHYHSHSNGNQSQPTFADLKHDAMPMRTGPDATRATTQFTDTSKQGLKRKATDQQTQEEQDRLDVESATAAEAAAAVGSSKATEQKKVDTAVPVTAKAEKSTLDTVLASAPSPSPTPVTMSASVSTSAVISAASAAAASPATADTAAGALSDVDGDTGTLPLGQSPAKRRKTSGRHKRLATVNKRLPPSAVEPDPAEDDISAEISGLPRNGMD